MKFFLMVWNSLPKFGGILLTGHSVSIIISLNIFITIVFETGCMCVLSAQSFGVYFAFFMNNENYWLINNDENIG